MPVKIRLSRHGKKGYAFYHIVVADSRAPRDGKFIEKIGTYNPNTNPATIELSFDKAIEWLDKGAQPTDTCRNILSHNGVMYKKHLNGGVKKGAFTQEVADSKFEKWMEEKAGQVSSKKLQIKEAKKADKASRLTEEAKVKEAKAKAIEAKRQEAVAAAEEAAAPAVEEAPVVEESAAPVEEEVAVEAATEAPAEA